MQRYVRPCFRAAFLRCSLTPEGHFLHLLTKPVSQTLQQAPGSRPAPTQEHVHKGLHCPPASDSDEPWPAVSSNAHPPPGVRGHPEHPRPLGVAGRVIPNSCVTPACQLEAWPCRTRGSRVDRVQVGGTGYRRHLKMAGKTKGPFLLNHALSPGSRAHRCPC